MRQIRFLCSPKYARQASTFLRATQLSSLVAPGLREQGFSVDCTTNTLQKDAFLILTKGFLVEAPLEEIGDLKRRFNVLVADYVDWRPDPQVVRLVDGLIASSHRQSAHLHQEYPDKPVHLVTHNIDQRIGEVHPPTDSLRVGYFGERFNARFADNSAR
jgi:hypothetical protein